MFSSVRNFLYRHKKKFLVTGVVVGGVYFLTGYAQRKLREWQERETRKFLEMTRKKQHFESTERTCNQTILSLARVVCANIKELLDTDKIILQLKENPENKLMLWEQLKITTFTRICSLVYAFCMLVVILRVQLNIIGGYLYKDSVANEGPTLINADLQSKYLSLCHHFISYGVEILCKRIEFKVKDIIEPMSLKKRMTLQDVEQIFWSIQASLCTDDNDPIKQIVNYLLADDSFIAEGSLDTIVKETMDVLESDEVVSLTMSSVSRCFSVMTDEVAYLFPPQNNKLHLEEVSTFEKPNGSSNGVIPFVDVNKVELPLAKLIPIVNDLIMKDICKSHSNVPDLLIQQLTLNDKLKLLGANVYEVFSG